MSKSRIVSGVLMEAPLNRRNSIVHKAMKKLRAGRPAWLALGLCLALFAESGSVIGASLKTPGSPIAITNSPVIIYPIHHATLVMVSRERTIYVDPVGDGQRFKGLPRPDLILVTDVHEDHLDLNTLALLTRDTTAIVAPTAVADKLPEDLRKRTSVLANGESNTLAGVTIEAVPMYNTTEERLKFHEKGRGNGYVVTASNKRVYVSGDTEDIPEMRQLKNIDAAFVCMNFPDTMTVEQAASAVREFKPKIVCPYHCRGSDLEKFKQLVGEEPGIQVLLRDWYR